VIKWYGTSLTIVGLLLCGSAVVGVENLHRAEALFHEIFFGEKRWHRRLIRVVGKSFKDLFSWEVADELAGMLGVFFAMVVMGFAVFFLKRWFPDSFADYHQEDFYPALTQLAQFLFLPPTLIFGVFMVFVLGGVVLATLLWALGLPYRIVFKLGKRDRVGRTLLFWGILIGSLGAVFSAM
jgi:hypothetical protein